MKSLHLPDDPLPQCHSNSFIAQFKKSDHVQSTEIYLLGLKVQNKPKIKLPLDIVSKHVLVPAP